MTGPNDITQGHPPGGGSQNPQDAQPVAPSRSNRKRSTRWIWFAAPALILLMLVVSILTGYYQGLAEREVTAAENAAQVARDQFDKGVEDLLAGNYELAQQRFEYVLSLDPEFEGASDFLNQALIAMNQPTATPSPAASPTPTETPDFSSFEGMFTSAQAAFAREDWDTALEIMIRLRGDEPEYRLAEVNLMMDVALRNRGMQKLFAGDLEQGIYDLTLSERFSPLDSQAASWRRSASFYVFANSFFGLDWALATEYFGQICQANIWGACTKYGLAAKEYAGELAKDGEDPCQAAFNYDIAFGYVLPGGVEATATEVSMLCATATAPTPTATITPTLIWTATPTATFVPGSTSTFTPSPTPGPSNTPTHTATTGLTATITLTPTETLIPSPTLSTTSTPTLTPEP
ncbi:MAG: hypothetical protein P1P76_03160 [Anaerolineales bacterium]|nr:hypothetical protein [Anaerolineales bacterium]